MSVFVSIAVGLGALAGLAMLLVIAGGLLIRWARRRLVAAGYCEFCFTQRAAFIANIDEHAPLGLCEGCRAKKLGPLATESMLRNGKLTPIQQGSR